MKYLPWFALVVFVLVFGSCSDKGDEVISTIQNSSWRLQAIESGGGQTTIIPQDELYTLDFTSAFSVSGRIHCNTYAADYLLSSGGSISFGTISQTKVGCPQPSNEDEVITALRNANSIQVAGNQLRLYSLDGTRVLRFTRLN